MIQEDSTAAALFAVHKIIVYSVAVALVCGFSNQIHVFKRPRCDRNIFRNYVLPPLVCCICNLFYVMANTCTESTLLEYAVVAANIFSSLISSIAVQCSIVVYEYGTDRFRKERQIHKGRVDPSTRHDQNPYHTDYHSYVTFRRLEIAFFTLSAAAGLFCMTFKLIITVSGECTSQPGGWRTGFDVIMVMLFPGLSIVYYLQGAAQRDEVRKLEIQNNNKVCVDALVSEIAVNGKSLDNIKEDA